LQPASAIVAASAADASKVRRLQVKELRGRRCKRENSPAAIVSPYPEIDIANMWHPQGNRRPAGLTLSQLQLCDSKGKSGVSGGFQKVF
jgi:hypothetical protein